MTSPSTPSETTCRHATTSICLRHITPPRILVVPTPPPLHAIFPHSTLILYLDLLNPPPDSLQCIPVCGCPFSPTLSFTSCPSTAGSFGGPFLSQVHEHSSESLKLSTRPRHRTRGGPPCKVTARSQLLRSAAVISGRILPTIVSRGSSIEHVILGSGR
jgi:hypothetical protein